MNTIDHLNSWMDHLDTALRRKTLDKTQVAAELTELQSDADSLRGKADPQELRDINRRIQYLRERINPMRLRQNYKSAEGTEEFFRNE